MAYADDSDRYQDPVFRGRATMCAREQAYIYANDSDPAVAALGRGVVGGSMTDIDAVVAAVITAPGNENLDDDNALLAATQAVWAVVADARYGGAP